MSTALLPPSFPSVWAPVAAWFKSAFLSQAVTFKRSAEETQVFKEAEAMRTMADDLLKKDPALAQELYAAADRHEYAQAVV